MTKPRKNSLTHETFPLKHNRQSRPVAEGKNQGGSAPPPTRNLIHRIDSLNDPDCVEGISLRLDVLKRYFVNIGIDDITLQLVDRAYQVIHQCEQRFKASIRSTGPAKVYTGKRGKPAFDINEEQLNFLLEQGFKVGEMSHMLGVGKRTLERRMHSFGLSVTGK